MGSKNGDRETKRIPHELRERAVGVLTRAREHLGRVVALALGVAPTVDEQEELLFSARNDLPTAPHLAASQFGVPLGVPLARDLRDVQ